MEHYLTPLTMSRLSGHVTRKRELRMFDIARILHGCTGFASREAGAY